VTLCVGLCLLGASVRPLSKSQDTPSPGAYSGFQLRVGAWVDFGHEGKCPGRELLLLEEKGVALSNPSPTDLGVWGSVLSSRAGSGSEPRPKTDYSAFHVSQNASRWDVTNIFDRVCREWIGGCKCSISFEQKLKSWSNYVCFWILRDTF